MQERAMMLGEIACARGTVAMAPGAAMGHIHEAKR
jgi:hypothetical protein